MDARQFLQCANCLKELDEFLELEPNLSTKEDDLLAEYTLFLELKRLRSLKVNQTPIPRGTFDPPLIQPNIRLYEDKLPTLSNPTITC